jgi:hypothetical protein
MVMPLRSLPLMLSTVGTAFNLGGGMGTTLETEMAKWCCLFSKIVGLMMPAEKLISRMPNLRMPSGKPNFERLGVKPPKNHEWADLTSSPFQDRSRRTFTQLRGFLDLAAERKLTTGGPKSALAQ